MSWTEENRVILVTGANRGIGFVLIKKLINELPIDKTTILLGSRDLKRGENAIERLNSPSNVKLLQLDTSSSESIIRAVDHIKNNYNGQIDVVINNAAILKQEITTNIARELFNTNYYGIKTLNKYLIPLMHENGRIINISSRVATIVLQEASQTIQDKYTCSTLTEDQLDKIVDEFILGIEKNNLENLGYNLKSEFLIYGVTKAALNALTQIEARQYSKEKNLLFISVTPGLCATDMTRDIPNGRSPELGANSIFYAVNTPRHELINGGFYRDGKQLPLINKSIHHHEEK